MSMQSSLFVWNSDDNAINVVNISQRLLLITDKYEDWNGNITLKSSKETTSVHLRKLNINNSNEKNVLFVQSNNMNFVGVGDIIDRKVNTLDIFSHEDASEYAMKSNIIQKLSWKFSGRKYYLSNALVAVGILSSSANSSTKCVMEIVKKFPESDIDWILAHNESLKDFAKQMIGDQSWPHVKILSGRDSEDWVKEYFQNWINATYLWKT